MVFLADALRSWSRPLLTPQGHGPVPCWRPKAMAHFMIVIVSPRSTGTPDTVCDCSFAVAMAMAIVIVCLRSGCSIINNNVKTSNQYCQHILPLSTSSLRPSLYVSSQRPCSCWWRVELVGGDDFGHRVVAATVTYIQQGIVVAVTDIGHVCISQLPLLACLRSTANVLLDTNAPHCCGHHCCLFHILQRRTWWCCCCC